MPLAIAMAAMLALTASATDDEGTAAAVEIRVERDRDRQVIDGFGGSLAYWGFNADEEALRVAIEEVGATIVRIPGEVAQSGVPDAHRPVLDRLSRVAPDAKVYVTFWQPRSADRPRPEDWLNLDAEDKYRLKPELVDDWAEEMVERLTTIRRDWGANVAAVGVQNEPNFSQPNTPTCAWEPDRLAEFTTYEFAPRLAAAGLGLVPIAAPELAYIGDGAGEAERFAPVFEGPAVSIFSYHMYDSYKDGTADPGFDGLRDRQRALGRFLREELPSRRVWMTETTGAQYNGEQWHTIGWDPALDEHDKAIAAARYMHAVLVDAGANAFLWWGLIYSAPPLHVEGDQRRQKFRDEGLVLVEPAPVDGAHRFLERTPKSYAYQQFAAFVRPGWVRLDVDEPAEPDDPLVAAFRCPDADRVAVVLIHPGEDATASVDVRVSGDGVFRLDGAFLTDRHHRCGPVEWSDSLTPQSVTTLVYVAE